MQHKPHIKMQEILVFWPSSSCTLSNSVGQTIKRTSNICKELNQIGWLSLTNSC